MYLEKGYKYKTKARAKKLNRKIFCTRTSFACPMMVWEESQDILGQYCTKDTKNRFSSLGVIVKKNERTCLILWLTFECSVVTSKLVG